MFYPPIIDPCSIVPCEPQVANADVASQEPILGVLLLIGLSLGAIWTIVLILRRSFTGFRRRFLMGLFDAYREMAAISTAHVLLLAGSMLLIGNVGGFMLARGLEKLAWQEVEAIDERAS